MARATPDGRSKPLRFLSQESSPVLPEVTPISTESRFVCPFSQADIARLVISMGSAPRNATPFKTVIFMPKFNKIVSYILIVPAHIIPAPIPPNANPIPLTTPETIDNVSQFLVFAL